MSGGAARSTPGTRNTPGAFRYHLSLTAITTCRVCSQRGGSTSYPYRAASIRRFPSLLCWNVCTLRHVFFLSVLLFGFCSSLPAGGQCEYRRALPPSFLFKFFVEVSVQLEACSLSAGPDGDLPPAPIIGDSDRREWFQKEYVVAGSDVNPYPGSQKILYRS